MKKTIYLVIISIITVAAIIYGTNFHFKKVNNNFKNFKEGIESIIEDENGNINFQFNFDDSVSFDDEDIDSKTEAFSNIKMDVKVGSVTIEKGDEYNFEATFNHEDLKPEFKVENGKLIVTQKKRNNNYGNTKCNIVVTVPSLAELDDIDVTVNVGELNVSDIICDNIKLKTNVGEVDVCDVEFTKLDVENNVGEIYIYTVDKIDDYSLDLVTNIGEVDVDGYPQKHKFSKTAATGKSIRAKSNVGEISIH